MQVNNIVNYDGFYFLGIGGVSMSALAKWLLSMGKKVAGSDASVNEYTEELQKAGVQIRLGCAGEDMDEYQAVVYTDAINECDEGFRRAKKLGKTLIPRGNLLAEACKNFNKVIAVSGCHGKTTCTCMLSHVLDAAKRKFACHIGGEDLSFSNFYSSGNDYFVTEACEYKKNFLKLKPDIAVVLNCAADHLECYGSEEELKKAYAKFANSAETSVCLYGELSVANSVTFGFDDRADYYAKKIKSEGGKYSFCVYEGADLLGTVKLGVYGKHNVLNALAAVAAARRIGLPFESIVKGLAEFDGVKRRFENIGTYNGAAVIADYAHHPDEIRAAIRTAKSVTDGEIFIVFQPHTYSRTKNLFGKFVRVLYSMKRLLVYKTYAAREYYDDAGSALTLSQSLKKSRYAESVRDIELFLAGAKRDDLVLFLGAGDIYYIAKSVVSG